MADDGALVAVLAGGGAPLQASLEPGLPVLVGTLESTPVLQAKLVGLQGLSGPPGALGSAGPRGPRGVPGVALGSTLQATKLSAGPVSSGRVLRALQGGYVDTARASEPAHAMSILGLAAHAVSAAEQDVDVVTFGEHEDSAWAFAPGQPVFAGPDGLLTQAPSLAWAFVRVVGFAVTPTVVFVSLQPPIFQP